MKHPLIALAFALAVPGIAIAATDGIPSETESEGTFDILLTVTEPQLIQITGLEDATFDLEPDQTADDETLTPCIFMSGPITTYDLEIGGDVLTDQTTNYPYSVTFQSLDGASVTHELALAVQDTENAVQETAIPASLSATCAGNRTTNIVVSLDASTPLATTNGQASATVTVTVSPTA